MPKEPTSPSAIGQRLILWRKAQSLSQDNIAQLLNQTSSAWSRYEKGSALPQASKLARLGKHFEMDLNVILTGEPSTQTQHLAQQLETALDRIYQLEQEALAQASILDWKEEEIKTFKRMLGQEARPLPIAQAERKTKGQG